MSKICQAYAGRVWDKYDERTHFLPRTPDQANKGRDLHHPKQVCKRIIKEIRMESSKSVSTPMTSSCKLDKDEHGKSVDSKLYRGMIDSLLYLTVSRPDIMFSVCMYARF